MVVDLLNMWLEILFTSLVITNIRLGMPSLPSTASLTRLGFRECLLCTKITKEKPMDSLLGVFGE
jgi:hypothetical protein